MNSVTTIEDALRTRRSCRAFLPTPVPRAEVERLLALAARSDHVIVCGVALAYADDSHRLSSHRTTREPVAWFATFYDSEVSRRVDSA
jgi:hypothetical protein